MNAHAALLFRPACWLFLLLAAALPAARAQILILYGASGNANWAQDVSTKLQSTNLDLGAITIYDAYANSAPSTAFLQQYKAVLVFSDSGGFSDPIGVGNALAGYVDAGGGVVEAVFANGSIPITGAWLSEGYTPFTSGSQNENTPLTLGTIYDLNSPILAGVTSFSGGSSSYISTGALTTNAVRVADWSNGAPLIVLSPGFNGRIVSLNFFPPSSDVRNDFWTASTDGALILANALNFVAIPEPSTYALLALGTALLGLAHYRRRRV